MRWLRGDNLLADSSDPQKAPPPRFALFNNGSMLLKNIASNDTDEYTCEVISAGDRFVSKIYVIDVQCK